MKTMTPAIIAVMVILGVAWRLFAAHSQPKKLEFKSLDERMEWLSTQAVDMANKNFGIKLDYTPNSVKRVDEILGKLHDEYVASQKPDGVKGLAVAYGGYIGDVIKRQNPDAKWSDKEFQGEKVCSIDSHEQRMFVCAWCYNRIVNGDEDNVWFKYTASNSLNGGKPQLTAK